MKIRFARSFPREFRTPLARTLRAWAPVFAHVLSEVEVALSDQEDGGARVWPAPQYRRAVIAVSADFLQRPSAQQAEFLLHELSHALVEDLARVASHVLQAYQGASDEEKAFAQATLTHECDRVTEQVAQALLAARAAKRPARRA